VKFSLNFVAIDLRQIGDHVSVVLKMLFFQGIIGSVNYFVKDILIVNIQPQKSVKDALIL
jgi:hypothetical protein